MSALDPLAALSARVAAAQAAMLEAAIDLGVSAELLQAQVRVGDILPAKILAPQNGRDFIEILGKPLAAQLPAGVHPGETLLLQVTGFSAAQMYVRNLGAPDPHNPLPVSDAVLKPAGAPADQSAKPAPSTPPVSPPRAVFVAASVRQAAQAAASAAAPSAAAPSVAEPSAATPASVPRVEARIAAAQAAAAATPFVPPAAEVHVQPQPPMISERAAAAAPLTRAVKTVSEFLRAARVPDTPFTRMAATIAPHAAQRLPSVLQRLEAALPRAAQDARIATLRTLVAFTARLDPERVETLRAQISAYVSNAVQGAEAKVQQLLIAHTQAQPAPQRDAPPAAAQARAVERAAAVAHDLKSVVLSLLREPPADRTPALSQALSETLMTLTGVQIQTLSSNQQNPGTMALTLPVYYHEGGKPAQIRISRDAESRAAKMDADNFHVAFVLDTAHLGTVAIDLQTTGRTVKLDVKTETATAAERFSDTLSSLRARLEDLRYRVASAAAGAVRAGAPRTAQAQPQKQSGVDLHA